MIEYTDEFKEDYEQALWEAEMDEVIYEGMKEQEKIDEMFITVYAKQLSELFDDETNAIRE